MIDIERQIVTAGFLAGFDQDHAARLRQFLFAQRKQRGERAEQRIAIIGAAAAIQPVALEHRYPRPEAFGPAGHFRLLVEMTVEQHAVVLRAAIGGRDVDVDHRRAARQLHDFERRARQGGQLAACPVRQQCHRRIHVAVLFPLRIEHRRLVRDANVLDELRHDLVVPQRADSAFDLIAIHGLACCCEPGQILTMILGAD